MFRAVILPAFSPSKDLSLMVVQVPASLLFVGVMLAMCAFSAPTDNRVVEHAVKNLVETDTKIAESVSAPDELVEDELVEVPKPKPSVDNLVVEHEVTPALLCHSMRCPSCFD